MPETGKYFGKELRTGRGLTLGDPASPMIFNILVGAVVTAVLDEVCRPQEAHHGLGWASEERNLIFYANNGRIEGKDLEWVQGKLLVWQCFAEWDWKQILRKPRPWYIHQVSYG